MVAYVRAREIGVDFSFARPPAARLLKLGYTFIVGYISVPPASPKKNLTRAECEAYLDAGLNVLLVWEMDAARPNLGATYGAIDGKNAAIRAKELGYPTDVPILCAADLNTVAANINQHEGYMRAFGATCGPWPMGIYGDTDILARCAGLWRIGWVPIGAWAWSGTSYANAIAKAKAVGAHVLQRKGFYIDNVWAVDPNDVIADFPVWSALPDPDPFPPPVPPNPPVEDEMIVSIFELVDSKAAFVADTQQNGLASRVRWSGAGNAKWADRRATILANGGRVLPASIGNLINFALDGPLPEGDPDHTWDGSEFSNTAEIQAASAPVVAVDETARQGVAFLHAENEARAERDDKLRDAQLAAWAD